MADKTFLFCIIIESYNFVDKIQQELKVGPFQLTLSDLGVSQDIIDKLNNIPKYAQALAAVYILSCLFVGLSMLGTLAGFFLLPREGRLLPFSNFAIGLLAVFFLLASSLIATIAPSEVTKQLQQQGIDADAIGLEVIASKKLQGLTWAGFALMLLTMFFWFYELAVVCVRRRRTGRFAEKQPSYGK